MDSQIVLGKVVGSQLACNYYTDRLTDIARKHCQTRLAPAVSADC